MTARNANWDRWVYASVAKHLAAEVTAPIVFDFGGRRTGAWEGANSRGEVTIGGLRSRQKTRNSHAVECDVFVIITSNQSAKYNHVDAVGDVANALDQCILVKDYGATGLVEVGRLGHAKENTEFVEPTHIKPKADDDLIHSTIRVKFEGTFRN